MQTNEKLQKVYCCKNHNQSPFALNLEDNNSIKNRLLCLQCIEEKNSVNIITLSRIQKIINKKQESIKNSFINDKQEIIKWIETLQVMLQQQQQEINQFYQVQQQIIDNWIVTLNNLKIDESEDLLINIQKYYIQQKDEVQQKKENIIQLASINKNFQKQIKIEINQLKLDDMIKSMKIQIKNGWKQIITSVDTNYTNKQFVSSFNFNDQLLLTTKYSEIKIKNIENKEQIFLRKHQKPIFCIVQSKYSNWFVSSGYDFQLICWKAKNTGWEASQSLAHSFLIQQLILTNKEDQLISCDQIGNIVLYKVDIENNTLTFLYIFKNGHQLQNDVFSISVNQNDDSIISCSRDKQIILWRKNQLGNWFNQFSKLQKSYGYRICFISNNEFIWKPYDNGILNIFQCGESQFEEQIDLQVKLNDEQTDQLLFPPVFLKNRNLLILKHNKYVYFLKRNFNKAFEILNIINCFGVENFGTISNSGKLFINWNSTTEESKLYKVEYFK